MEELTVREIASILGLQVDTVRKRMKTAGIRPDRLVGTTAIYSPDVADRIRAAKPAHRPKKDDPKK